VEAAVGAEGPVRAYQLAPKSTVWYYTPGAGGANGTWATGPSLQQPRYGHTLAAAAGRLWAMGGTVTGNSVETNEVYVPGYAAPYWQYDARVPAALQAHAAAAVTADGPIIVAGGQMDSALGVFNDATFLFSAAALAPGQVPPATAEPLFPTPFPDPCGCGGGSGGGSSGGGGSGNVPAAALTAQIGALAKDNASASASVAALAVLLTVAIVALAAATVYTVVKARRGAQHGHVPYAGSGSVRVPTVAPPVWTPNAAHQQQAPRAVPAAAAPTAAAPVPAAIYGEPAAFLSTPVAAQGAAGVQDWAAGKRPGGPSQ
jgi:hypothetical protein